MISQSSQTISATALDNTLELMAELFAFTIQPTELNALDDKTKHQVKTLLARLSASLSSFTVQQLTPEFLLRCAKLCLEHSQIITAIGDRVVDITGTGGDAYNTFNISTTAAFVVAGAGVRVAKSTKGNSVDLLTALGVKLSETPEIAKHQLANYGLSFVVPNMFNPHLALLNSLCIEQMSILKLLYPLLNPGLVKHQAIGVATPSLVSVYAEALKQNTVAQAIVFHGNGLDELALSGSNTIALVKQEQIETVELAAHDFGLPACCLDDLLGGHPKENSEITQAILHCDYMGPKRNTVILNAAAGIYVGYPETITIVDAVHIAQEAIDSGAALKCLQAMQADSDLNE